jgi:hypothetical protein
MFPQITQNVGWPIKITINTETFSIKNNIYLQFHARFFLLSTEIFISLLGSALIGNRLTSKVEMVASHHSNLLSACLLIFWGDLLASQFVCQIIHT